MKHKNRLLLLVTLLYVNHFHWSLQSEGPFEIHYFDPNIDSRKRP